MPTRQVKLSARKSCCPDKKAALPCCYLHCFLLCLWEEHTGHNTSCQASSAVSPLTPFLLSAAQVVFSGRRCPRTEMGLCAEPVPGRLPGASPSAAAHESRAVPEQISPESRQGSFLLYTQHLAGLGLLLSIWAHLWQGMCWCPEVAQPSLFPGSWITGVWRTAQWNSGRQALRLLAGLFFCLLSPLNLLASSFF